MELDAIDRKILTILQDDARITNKALSERLGLSPPPTLERVKKLERLGFIRGYVALLDPDKISLGTTMLVEITLKEHTVHAIQTFREEIIALPEVLECYHITGVGDYMIKVVCRDNHAYEHFISHKLSALANIGKINTAVVLAVVKQETRYPILPVEDATSTHE